ncbi:MULTISPECIES: hypothetical protein [Streptomyces]|uniref:hypothetical protein n=1 Tax=Streptomyces TaxID=1883 RepID=UPI0004ABB953|nr:MULTISPECIES: hypothetical protein [Streptomyces]
MPDPTAALGAVGDVIKLVTGLLSTVTSGALDLSAVQQLVATLLSTLQGLIGQLPTPPVTVPTPPVTVPAPTTVPGSAATLHQQLDALRAQAQALTAAARSHPATG